MNEQDRKLYGEMNEKLGRVLERTENIWSLTEKQELHLTKLNSRTSDNERDIATNKNGVKYIRWIIGAVWVAIAFVVSRLQGVL